MFRSGPETQSPQCWSIGLEPPRAFVVSQHTTGTRCGRGGQDRKAVGRHDGADKHRGVGGQERDRESGRHRVLCGRHGPAQTP